MHKRYLCAAPACAIQFLPGGSVLRPDHRGTPQATQWQPSYGCPKCGGPVELIAYTPRTPGLDIEHAVEPEPVPVTVQPIALPLREKDGSNHLLAPDPVLEKAFADLIGR